MRLTELSFERVGLWKELPPLRLGRRVTLVLGDNEAGKSSAMRAVEALLFGTSKALVAPLPSESSFAAAASATLADGTEVRFERRGRRLVSPSLDAPASILDPNHAARFRDLFRIDHANVRADARFLAEDGALGRVLFAATAGASAADLSRLEAAIRERVADARSGRKGSDGLKVRLDAYRETKAEVATKPQFGAYDAEADEVARLGAVIREATGEIAALDEDARRLDALAAGLADDATLEAHRRTLAALEAEGPIPPLDWPARIEATFARVTEAEGALAEAAEAERLAAAAVAEAPAATAIVTFEAEIGEVERDVAALETEQAELATRRRALGDKRSKLVELVTALGARADDGTLLATAESLLLAAPRQKALAEAIDRGERLAAAEHDAKGELADARRALEKTKAAAQEVPAASTVELESALRVVGELESLAMRRDEKRGIERDQRTRAESLATKLGLAAIATNALASVPVRGRDAIESAWARRQATETAASVATGERAVVEKRLAEATEALERLGVGASAPSREALDEAREARDRTFGALKSMWTPTLRSEAERELPSLASVYERQAAEADAVADRRFDDAERIGRWEAVRAERQKLEGELERASELEREARSERSAAEQAWGALFPFLPAPPSDPKEWLREHQAMLDALRAAEVAASEAEGCDTERDRLRRDLATLVGAELPSIAALESEAMLRSELGRAIAERRARNEQASAHAADVRTATNALAAAERTVEQATEALAGFRRQWRELVAEVPASVGGEAVAVREWVVRQEALRATAADVRALEGEVSARIEAIAAREGRVRELFVRVREVEPALSVLERLGARDVARELGARARAAVERRRAHEAAVGAHDAAAKQCRQSAAAVATRRDELSALWREAGLSGGPDAAGIERASARATAAREQRTAIARLEAVLATHWPMGIDAARSEIAGRSADELAATRDEKLARRRTLAERRDELIGERARAQARLDALGASPDAADVAQRLAFARGRVLERADEVVHLEVAEWLLAKAKERAAEGARPIVERASSIFAALTDGAYDGLAIDRDGAGPSLLAFPKDGRPKTVSELSDGTCDAIWLALRLAVAAEAARETPFPLLLDDVFVHLDDRRTAAALRVLASLSERVQVIVFTHHDHVVDLARAAIADALEVVVLATPETGERVRTLADSHVRHERPPAPMAEPLDVDAAGSTGHDEARDAVLEALRAGGAPMGKSELVEAVRAAGVELDRVWGAVLARLKQEGSIVQTGERRGARYALAPAGPSPASPSAPAGGDDSP